MIAEDAMLWLVLRQRRFALQRDSQLLKQSSSRRATLAAAMEQFEEQMVAAKTVTAATRPLNLYYGLAQAGMAIAAVHVPGQWSFSSHGLNVCDTKVDFMHMQVAPIGDGAFQRVATAIHSEQISSPVDIQALWSSLPDLASLAPLPDADSSSSLILIPKAPFAGFSSVTIVNGRKYEMPAEVHPPMAEVIIEQDLPESSARQDWIRNILANYPAASRASVASDQDAFEQIKEGRSSVKLEWPSPDPSRNLSEDEVDKFFDAIAPEYRYNGDRYLRPAILASQPPPSPLMTWWLLLYSFSILARYQPRIWLSLLDLNNSQYAAHLQLALDLALSVIPQLVLEALDQRPVLHPKPMTF